MIPFPYLSAHPTGSRYTVMPAVLDTDDDWLVLVEDLGAAERAMVEMPEPFRRWHPCSGVCQPKTIEELQYGDYSAEAGAWRFSAWRNGYVNLIVTDDRVMYLRSVAATLLARQLNLQTKEERVALFWTIKFGDDYTGKLP